MEAHYPPKPATPHMDTRSSSQCSRMSCKFCGLTVMRGKAQNNFRLEYKSKKLSHGMGTSALEN